MKIQNIKAFSLIEVLIFVTILSLFFVTASYVVTVTMRNMKINEHKILATRYAEELQSWLKSKQEYDWRLFASIIHTDGETNKVYCFNSGLDYDYSGDPQTSFNRGWNNYAKYNDFTLPNDRCPNEFTSLNPTIFTRFVHLEKIDQNVSAPACNVVVNNQNICQIKVNIEVRWKELGNIYTVPLTTIFSVWEQ